MPRIVTHTDFDGLISALLLRDILNIEFIVFAEPWMIQQKEFDVMKGDIIVDLPFDERCALWIDHHASNTEDAIAARKERPGDIIFDETKKSCPSLIYEHYHGKYAFLDEKDFQELIAAADKIDSASFTKEEIENPDAYGRISIALKTDDKKKDDQFRLFLLNLLSFQSAEKVAEQPAVKARVQKKLDNREKWMTYAKRLAREIVGGKIVILDYTELDPETDVGDAPPLFLYALFPNSWFTIIIDRLKYDTQRYKCSIGKNIFSKESQESAISFGELMKARGGGGHRAAAGCNFAIAEKETFLKELIDELSEGI